MNPPCMSCGGDRREPPGINEHGHCLDPRSHGWYAFGWHIDIPGPLEFYGEDEGGLPIFERPVVRG